MKRFLLSLTIITCILISLVATGLHTQKTNVPHSDSEKEERYAALNHDKVKAVWLSQFDMRYVYNDGTRQRSPEEYSKLVDKIIENLSSIGINTVFFQVRPNGDSIYPSKLYPTSKYLSGSYGVDSEYDAFAIFLAKAHAADISVHAWINPLRCMSESDILLISDNYKIKKWYETRRDEYIVAVDGTYYLNPAYPEVRELICNGVAEIIKKYDVDGIHIDDYFYPTTSEYFDVSVYADFAETLSLQDFRREQINSLVRELYFTVKKYNDTVLFGVSPSGNTERNYNELYADVSLWCSSDCYIDYVCPQVYFGFRHETHSFDKICDEFSNMTTNKSIRFFVGITAEKAYNAYYDIEDKWAGDGSREWIEDEDILKRSVEYAQSLPNCDGVAIFSYRLLFDSISGLPITETAKECDKMYIVLKNA